MITSYNELRLEVESFVRQIHNDETLHRILNKHYKGTQILYSPLYYKPKIMIIGINPGAGFKRYEGRNAKRFSPMEFMEYVGGKFIIAQQTRKLFRLAGLSVLDLKNSVKTNCFFFATKGVNELAPLLRNLEKYDVKNKSKMWVAQLISLVQPKLILCEGKAAFYRTIANRGCVIRTSGSIYSTNLNGIQVIGYSRRYSYIIDIGKVAQQLKEDLG